MSTIIDRDLICVAGRLRERHPLLPVIFSSGQPFALNTLIDAIDSLEARP